MSIEDGINLFPLVKNLIADSLSIIKHTLKSLSTSEISSTGNTNVYLLIFRLKIS